MKSKTLMILPAVVIAIFGLSMILEGINVPQLVKDAFAAKYPNAKKVDWEMEGPKIYEAEFKLDGKEMSACFKEDGTWVETETEMKVKDLPAAIKAALAAQFADYEIEEAEQLERPDLPLGYEVEIENEEDDTILEVVFDANGKVLEKKVEKEDDDDDDDDH